MLKRSRSGASIPMSSSVSGALPESRMRSTTDSASTSGSTTTRRSMWRPSIVRPMRPSWGRRRSAMSRFARILIRETTELTIRLGTCAASSITPSTRKRTWKPSVSGSKWTSDAPCSTAWAMIERTSLMVGASSADSRSSTRSSAVGCSSFSTASSTAPSRLDMRPTAVRMSSREATTGMIERPVIIARSSIARTLDGFAIATRSWPSLAKPIGSTSSRRATVPSTC